MPNPEVQTYQISVYRVQDRLRNCWTAEWEANSRYCADGPTSEAALRNLLRFLADTLPLQDQPKTIIPASQEAEVR